MQQGYCAAPGGAIKVDGTALSNTTTPTSLLPAGGKWTLPTGWFNTPGSALLVRAAGRISTLVTTPGTLTLDLRLGAVVVANGGSMVLSTTAKTNVTWSVEWLLTLRAVGGGTAANLMHQGAFKSESAGASTVGGESKSVMMPQSAPAVGTGFDETTASALDFFATWSVASASNSIQCHQFVAIALGSP